MAITRLTSTLLAEQDHARVLVLTRFDSEFFVHFAQQAVLSYLSNANRPIDFHSFPALPDQLRVSARSPAYWPSSLKIFHVES
jgi:hypothetical protein